MADKDTGGHELAILIAVISLIVAVVGAAAGLAQLQPVRDFACEEASVLCKREHVLSLFKMSYIGSTETTGNTDPWLVVLNNNSSLFLLPQQNNTSCTDEGDLSLFLTGHNSARDGSIYTISFGNYKWNFNSMPIDTNKPVTITSSDALIFFLGSKYVPLVRDVTLHVTATVEDHYRQYPQSTVDRNLVLPKNSNEKDVFCEVFFPHQGEFKFRFSFRDDVWDADDPIVVPLTIATGPE